MVASFISARFSAVRVFNRSTASVAAAFFASLALSTAARGAIIQEKILYRDSSGAEMEGVAVYEDNTKAPNGSKRPGVIVVHDWRGITDTTLRNAEKVAKLGYVAFAADIYGKGIRPKSPEESGAEAGKYKGDRALFRQRERAALDTIRKLPQVDPERIAAIGYCFGGTGVIEMARDGLDLRGVVSFHGGLDAQPLTPGARITAPILVLAGADDPYQKPEDLAAFEKQLREEKADYTLVFYGGAVHSFTEKEADGTVNKGAKYDATADRRSWEAMKSFLAEVFGEKPAQ